jgi:hypothetical protein
MTREGLQIVAILAIAFDCECELQADAFAHYVTSSGSDDIIPLPLPHVTAPFGMTHVQILIT